MPGFLKTLFRRKLVLWFLFSEILRDYWLSGVRVDFFLYLIIMAYISVSAVWAKLDLLVERQHPEVAYSDTRHCFLHWCLGRLDAHTHALQQNAYMVTPCVRRRAWRTTMVPNALGYFFFGPLHPVGWITRTLSWALSLVVAWRFGCYSGRWVRDDPVADIVSTSRLRHPSLLSNHRIDLCYGCTCNSSKRYWTWKRIPRCCQVGY